jgi:hypothetical protein
MATTNFIGDKKSLLPWIISGLVLLGIILGYILYTQNKTQVDQTITSAKSSLNSATSSVSSAVSSALSSNSNTSSNSSGVLTNLDMVSTYTTTSIKDKKFDFTQVTVVSITGDKTAKISTSATLDNKAVYVYFSNYTTNSLKIGNKINVKGTILSMPDSNELASKWNLSAASISDALTYPVYFSVEELVQ